MSPTADLATLYGLAGVALDALPYGVMVVDEADLVVLCNQRFVELYGLAPDVVRPGMTVRAIVEHAQARGLFPGESVEGVLARRAARLRGREASKTRHVMPDGRVIEARYRPMPSGGWLAVYQDISERWRAKAELEEQNRRFDAAMTSMAQGLCLFGPDERLIVCNARYLEIYGLTAEVVKPGITLREIIEHGVATHDHTGQSAGTLYEERMAMVRSGRASTARQAFRNGRVVEVTCRPMADGGWIATYDDVTEKEQAEEARRKQGELFETALTNMAHGLFMLDDDQRIIVMNRRVVDLYDLSPDVVTLGVSARTMIEHSAARGNYRDLTPEQAWQRVERRLAAREHYSIEQTLPGGRTIAITYTPMPQGGWVTTHEDVTERKRVEEELRQQNVLFDAAIEHMSHGLCMFDADLRIRVANARFCELLGFARHIAAPGTPLIEVIRYSKSLGNYGDQTPEEVFDDYRRRLIENREPVLYRELANGRTIAITHKPMANGGWVATYEDLTERFATERSIREQNLRFDTALSNMSQGLCMLDAEYRITVCNGRYREILGLSDSVVGTGSQLRDVIAHGVAIGLHPDRSVDDLYDERLALFRRGEAATLRTRLANGRLIETAYRPMANGGWVATYDDITERQRAEEALHEQNLRFDAALNNMSQGLCMLDPDLRIIVFNQRYLDIFGLSPAAIRAGMSMREVMHHSVAIGNHADTTADALFEGYRAHLKANPSAVVLRRLSDGRTIEITHEPMMGGGWVATYEDITARLAAEDRIAHMATHDALTGMPNRILLRERLEQNLARVTADGEAIAVLCLDLDHFKVINDTLGHSVGDELLKQVSTRIRDCLSPTDTAARLGGDEFAVLQIGGRQPHAAEILCRRLVQAIGQPMSIEGHEVTVGTSIGVALAPAHGLEADMLMKSADLALYKAKADGRRTHRFFEREMDARIQARRALELDLRRALAQGELELHYQPLIDLRSDQISGFEALLRWRHPERGFVPPSEFIPLAEDTGLINPLSEWVLREACAEAAQWPSPIKIAVNLSPAQFRGRGLSRTIVSAIAASGLPADRLELEITESVLLQENDATLLLLHQLRDLGVRICLDDFGTGYSSLSYLRAFPFDKIKIDRSFVRDLDHRADCQAIVRAIANLASSLGMDTTAEGVETLEQLAMVRAQGCTSVQGYLFSPARPAAEARAFIAATQPIGRAAVA